MANINLTIQHGSSIFAPPLISGVQVEWSRVNEAGKLTFKVLDDVKNPLRFAEGDCVRFYYKNNPIFLGYVFTRKYSKDNQIEVTAYDQLRYLKNKFAYVFERKTASQIIKSLAADYELTIGKIDDTRYIIPAIAEENSSAFDIILSVLQETLTNTGDMYVLYDDFGKLMVRDVLDMAITTLINEETAEDYDYTSSIDKDVYNNIVLYYKDNGSVKVYSETDTNNATKWGLLRYFDEVKNPSIGSTKAKSLLKLYNRLNRQFKIKGAFGDVRVRGGTMLPVQLTIGTSKVNNYMLVDKVTHNFDEYHHSMDLTLEGAWADE